jgi:nucleoside-diphosphate-sugar epimerase
MKRAFVTGASGFLGLNLTNELLKTGEYEVSCMHRKNSNLSELAKLNVNLKEGSLLDVKSLIQAIPQEVDVIFHCAANINMWKKRNAEQTKDNVIGTKNMVTAALNNNAKRFIHTSSIAAYGMHEGKIDEKMPSNAASSWINYIKTKYLAEQEVRRAIKQGLSATFINPCHIVGPYDERGWATLIRLALKNQLPAVPSGIGSFCHVQEVARAHIAAVDKGNVGENYLLGGVDASFKEFVDVIANITQQEIKARKLPRWFLNAYAYMLGVIATISGRVPEVTPEIVATSSGVSTCDCAKAQQELGYQARSLKEMIGDYIDWFNSKQ